MFGRKAAQAMREQADVRRAQTDRDARIVSAHGTARDRAIRERAPLENAQRALRTAIG